MTKSKITQCPKCGKNSSEIIEEEEFKHAKKISKILKSNKTSHEKKMELFNWLRDLDVGELQSKENQRVNPLLLGKLYAELAKQSTKEYKKISPDIFNKEK